MVGHLDEATEGEGYSEGLESTVSGWRSEATLKHEDDGHEDESHGELSEEGLPLLAESVGVTSHVEVVLSVGVGGGEDGHTALRDAPLIVDVCAESDTGYEGTEKPANNLRDHDQGAVESVFFVLALVNVDASGHRGVEVASRDTTEDDDDSEEGEGDGERLSLRHDDHVNEESCADEFVSCHK